MNYMKLWYNLKESLIKDNNSQIIDRMNKAEISESQEINKSQPNNTQIGFSKED